MNQKLINILQFKFYLYKSSYLREIFHTIRVKYFMLNHEKKLFDIKLKPKSIIFDVGGYEGTFTNRLINNNAESNFYIFEPIFKYYKNIKNKFKNINNVFIFPFGLSNRDTKVPLEMNLDRTSHNKYIDDQADFELSSLKRISTFIVENKLSEIDLIKLNVEGAEYEILEDLIDSNLLKNIKVLLIQFHLNQSEDYNKYIKIRDKILMTHKCDFNSIFVWEKFSLR